MTIWKLIRLNFGRNVAHFGELGIGMEETSERVRSDTLFSAWVSTYARLFGKPAVESLLQQFLDARQPPPFRLSSTFLYRSANEQYTYYLPRLLEPPRYYPIDNDLEFAKTLKRLHYLPLSVWQRWYQGTGFSDGDRHDLINKTAGEAGGELEAAGAFSYSTAFAIAQVPKIAVDRTTRATNLYHTGFVQFQLEAAPTGINHAGLYCLLQFAKVDPLLEADLEAALHLLGEEGLGGERSSGAGRFQVEWLDLAQVDDRWQQVVNFAPPTLQKQYSLISLFWDHPPTVNALLTDTTRYTIQERGGWIASPFSGRQLRRKAVSMFAEGSVFSEAPIGQLADVTPDGFRTHKIYRSGISLSLPIHKQSA